MQRIVDGEIERERCVGGREAYGVRPGKRKLMLKDAKRIAENAITRINAAVNRRKTLCEIFAE